MKHRAIVALLALLAAGGVCGAQQAAPATAPGREHRLIVATNPETYFSTSYVDQIIRDMNILIAKADPSCAGINFVRSEPIIYNDKLLLGGFADDLEKNLAATAPAANVFLVTGITNCGTLGHGGVTDAAGCTPMGPARAMAVVDQGATRNPVVWVHERGHAMGLGHWKQGQPDSAMSNDDFANIMYWQALEDAHLLQPGQCGKYRVLSGSVFPVVNNAMPAPAPGAQSRHGALTDNAAKVLAGPWQHGIPLLDVKSMSVADVDSVFQELKSTNPNPDWRKMLTILAYKSSENYMSASQMVLNREKIEVPKTDLTSSTQSPEFEDKASQARALSSAKQAVPIASGIYAYNSGDIRAAYQLSSLSNPKIAVRYVDFELAPSVSRAASVGLAIASANPSSDRSRDIAALTQGLFRVADEPARLFSDSRLEFTSKSSEDAAKQAAAEFGSVIDKDRVALMNRVYDQVKERGLDDFLASGVN